MAGFVDKIKNIWDALQQKVDTQPEPVIAVPTSQPTPVSPPEAPAVVEQEVVVKTKRNYAKVNPLVLDLSHHNVIRSFAEIKNEKIVGVILKSTQGARYVDKAFATRRKEALAVGLLVGAYHFGDASSVSQQVINFLRTVEYETFGKQTLLCLDYEPNPGSGGTMSLSQAKEFLKQIYERTGQRPVLYSGNLIKEKLGKNKDEFLAQHRLWIAQYGAKAVVPPAWNNYWLWQFTDGRYGPMPHQIPGIVGKKNEKSGPCDINSFPGTAEELAKEWVQ
jgi:lysozyme